MVRPYPKRIEQVRRRIIQAGADTMLVTHLPNILYLTGFSGTAGALLIEPTRVILFTDGRYATQSAEEAKEARVRVCRGPLLGAVGEHLRKKKKARVIYESARMTVAENFRVGQAAGRAVRWLGRESLVEELRAVKDSEEIAAMRQAARLGCEVFQEILPLVKPGAREVELAAEIEYRMRRKGASGAAFDTIVASGQRAALPHARPTEKRVGKNELVVLDLGAILSHYCCDLTRTVYIGRAPARIRRWYQAVRQAQAAALQMLRAGAAAGEVDAAARRVLKGYRLAQHFVHSTGHGLGLEVHEVPRLAKGQKGLLQAGNVVTLEPGVYVPGVGGIRVEDDVAVFADRTEVLTAAPRDFLEL